MLFYLLCATFLLVARAQDGAVWAYDNTAATFQSNVNPVYYGVGTQSASGNNTVTIGTNASNVGSDSGVAIGVAAVSNREHAVAIGTSALATYRAVVLGLQGNTGTTGTEAVCIGPFCSSTGGNSVAVGPQSSANSIACVAIGRLATCGTTGTESIAMGLQASAAGVHGIAAGYNSNAGAQDSITLGNAATSGTTGNSAVVAGAFSSGTGAISVAIGASANASASGSVAVGPASISNVISGVAVGNGATTNGVASSISVGYLASPIDTAHSLAISLNAASLGAQSLGVTLNGGGYQILAYSSLYTTTAGSVTLTASSAPKQWITSTGSVTLPVVSTLQLGDEYTVANLSNGNVTVKSSGGNNKLILVKNTAATFTCISTSGTGTASWTVIGPLAAA